MEGGGELFYLWDSDVKKPRDIDTARRHCNNRMVAQFFARNEKLEGNLYRP